MQRARFYVGIDWGSERHAICVLDEVGVVIKERFVPNDATAVLIIAELTKSATPAEVHIGVETRRLGLVEALMARGYRVFTINPKQSDRFRERLGPSGAKNDRRDAFAIGSALVTDAHCFDLVEPEDAVQQRLRAVNQADEYVDSAFRAAANRLYSIVLVAMPTIIELCPGADEPWFWDLFQALLATDDVADDAIAKILKANRIRRLKVADIRVVLDKPRLTTTEGARAMAGVQGAVLVDQLRLLFSQRVQLVQALKSAVAAVPKQEDGLSDADIIKTIPGIGDHIAAVILVEGHQAVVRRNIKQLRALAGVAPVSRSTGKKEKHRKPLVSMRRASSRRLRNAVHHAATVASRDDPRFAAFYAAQRQRGASHGHACRVVGDRLLKILVAMLRSRTTFRAAEPVDVDVDVA